MNLVKYIAICVCIFLCTKLFAQNSSITLYDLNQGGSSNPANLCTTTDYLYFSADDGINGVEPWFTNGTGTPAILINLHPSQSGLQQGFHKMITAQNDLFFVQTNHNTIGWIEGTHIYIPSPPRTMPVSPKGYRGEVLATYHDTLIFPYHVGGTGFAYTLLKLDINGTPAFDTVHKFNMHWPKEIKHASDRIYYFGYTGQSSHLVDVFCINMTNRTVRTVVASLVRPQNDYHNNMISLGGYMYFIMHTPQHGNELYRDNGATLEQLTDLRVGSESGVYGGHNVLYAYKGKIFFSGYDSLDRVILYQYDPSTKSVSSVNNPWTQTSYYPSHFTEYNGKLFFSCADTVHGTELYVYDGINPPYLAADIMPGKASSEPTHLTVFKNDLYFAGLSSLWQIELYRYNDSALTLPTFPSGNMKQLQVTQLKNSIHPNPTTQDAYLNLELKEAQNLSITVSDINGRIAYSLDSKLYSQGMHTICLPLANIPAGTYFYSIVNKNSGILSGGQIIKQ